MKTVLLAVALFLVPISAEAHSIKRNCLWAGPNIFRAHMMCSDRNSQPRATPSRSERPAPKPDEPDKPDCKDDDKDDDKDKGYDRKD